MGMETERCVWKRHFSSSHKQSQASSAGVLKALALKDPPGFLGRESLDCSMEREASLTG